MQERQGAKIVVGCHSVFGVHSSSPCRNAAETLEELKSIAQLLRLADKEANAKAEEFKKEGNDADLPAALRRRNKMRQGVQVVHHLLLRLPLPNLPPRPSLLSRPYAMSSLSLAVLPLTLCIVFGICTLSNHACCTRPTEAAAPRV
jgi:hypothetical protein